MSAAVSRLRPAACGEPARAGCPPPARACDLVVLAAGNPARGDDALGPLLAERLAVLPLPGLRLISDFQFQLEHALELAGARRALFIDAHRSQRAPVCLGEIDADAGCGQASHVLTPAEVLAVADRIGQPRPPAWQLSLRGEDFGLGRPLGPSGRLVLAFGWGVLRYLIANPSAAQWRALARRLGR
ncbi:MAG: homospermidine synthase [Rhodocyclaceae bacterium]|nr:homospermidine synthase [Rhodocyclaceae bacterium]